jgi:hypothetical protein
VVRAAAVTYVETLAFFAEGLCHRQSVRAEFFASPSAFRRSDGETSEAVDPWRLPGAHAINVAVVAAAAELGTATPWS